jgi:anti-sigma B factor antagonist
MPESLNSPTPRRGAGLKIDQRALDEHTVVLQIAGDLELVSAPDLRRSLYRLLDEGHCQLVLDLRRVSFMDSTALGVIVAFQRKLGDGQRLAIAGPTPDVLRMFELSGLAAAFPIFPKSEAAVGYVRGAEHRPGALSAPPLTGDAALTLGIASTAMPFAQSLEDQAERWLRVLRHHGEAGAVLASIGASETAEHGVDGARDRATNILNTDVIAAVTENAGRIATRRRAPKVATTDLLLGVMHVYGAVFDRVLAAHGADVGELAGRVADGDPATAGL